MMSEISSAFQIISVHLSLPLFNFKQGKDKSSLYLFNAKKIDTQFVQVSLVAKYSLEK